LNLFLLFFELSAIAIFAQNIVTIQQKILTLEPFDIPVLELNKIPIPEISIAIADKIIPILDTFENFGIILFSLIFINNLYLALSYYSELFIFIIITNNYNGGKALYVVSILQCHTLPPVRFRFPS